MGNQTHRPISPARATIVFASEPLWGKTVDRGARDGLPALAVLAAGFLVAGVVARERKSAHTTHPPRSRRRDGELACSDRRPTDHPPDLSRVRLRCRLLGAVPGALIASALMLAALAWAASGFVPTSRNHDAPLLLVPRGIVVLLAGLAGVTFLTEGAILDWGALLLSEQGLTTPESAGIGYSVFAVAMTAGRLTGDRVVAKIGDRRTMFWGGVLALGGYAALLTTSGFVVALAGLLLIGLGVSNTVPVLFRRAGAQAAMPYELAIASVTTVGYAGVLAGPAAIGFVAQHTGLPAAFWMLAGLFCLVPLSAGTAASSRT